MGSPLARRTLVGACACLAVAALVLVVALTAGAQDAVSLDMAGPEDEIVVGSGNETTVTLEVTNAGSLDGEASLSVESVPTAWNAELDPDTLTVPAGETQTTQLVLTAPRVSPDETSAGDVEIQGTLTDDSGQFSDTDTVSVSTSVEAPAPPPPPDEGSMLPWLVGSGIAGLLLVGLGVRWVRREPPQEVFDVAVGDVDRYFDDEPRLAVDVTNVDGDSRVADLSVTKPPEGWQGAFNRERVRLEPEETRRVWLVLRPVSEDSPEPSHLTVRAEPDDEEHPDTEALLPLDDDTQQPEPPSPKAS